MERKRRLVNRSEQKRRMRLAVDLCSLYGITILFLHIVITLCTANAQDSFPGYYIVSMVNSVIATLMPALLLCYMGNGFSYYVTSRFKKTRPLDSFLLVVFGFTGCLTINMISSFIDDFLPKTDHTIYITIDNSFGSFLLVLVSTALFPAVCEEIGYRGYIYSSMSGYGHLTAVLFSSAIFGLMHSDFGAVIFAFLCGVLFGCIRKTSGIFMITVVVHFLNNAFSSFSSFIRLSIGSEAFSLFFSISNNIAYILMIVTFLILRHRKVRIFRFSKAPGPLTKKDKLTTVFFSPVFLLFVFVAVLFKFL
ncbi:MAG: CPBP family intramembrane metalloprotease [Clostridia bacterium]|nr:CPBP family intramembrane metalloprotease [Clostridia bacterium]